MNIFKVGNVVKSKRDRVVQITKIGDTTFDGILLVKPDDGFFNDRLNTVVNGWSRKEGIWKIVKGYDTPLWKTLNN